MRHRVLVVVPSPRRGRHRRVPACHQLTLDAWRPCAEREPGAERRGWGFLTRAGKADAGACRGDGADGRLLVDVDHKLLAPIFGDGRLWK